MFAARDFLVTAGSCGIEHRNLALLTEVFERQLLPALPELFRAHRFSVRTRYSY